MNALTDTVPLTEEALMKAVQEGPYGRCVFYCDNDVVDNQKIVMQFENGITATLKMEAFVKYGGRELRFFGTQGYLELNEGRDSIILHRYMGTDETWKISALEGIDDHAFRVGRMIDTFYNVLIGESEEIVTSIDGAVESHYMAIAAEESRLGGGKLIEIEKYRNGKALVKDMLNYIQTHYLEDITLPKVAQAVGYSADHCSKALRAASGLNFRDYVNMLRLKRAEEMFADKSLKLTTLEVLYRCGFNNSATYYRAKKKLEKEGRILVKKTTVHKE
jgi:AraC-like DNA-binding protein